MENIDLYMGIVSSAARIGTMFVTAYLFCRLVRPFLWKRKNLALVGIAYFAGMVVMYVIPYEVDGMVAYAVGALAALAAMYVIDRRNIEQKIFLAVIMYLLQWISHSIGYMPIYFALDYIGSAAFWVSRPVLLCAGFIILEVLYVVLHFVVMSFFIRMIDRVYICKKENMSRKELGLMLAVPMSVLIGYRILAFISYAYLTDMGQYIWNVHSEYLWIEALYQMIAFAAIVVVIVFYQNIKENLRKEKENAVLAEQVASMESHISEAESMYREIRGLKHDMGNHVTILENLVWKNKQQEAAEYLSKLKEQLAETGTEVKSGNPVTDVILSEKQREADEKGIAFVCDFHYPEGTAINAFDVSVILNNAVGNAIEAAAGCDKPYIHIKSYRKKNAYMIEVGNRFRGNLVIDEESGLPETTKDGKEHGFGLLNIRKVAQKYSGDIDIEQDGGNFRLSIMLMCTGQ